jgi:outer membrane protein TolC
MLTEAMTLSISQNIPFTGGVLSFSSSLNRVDQFDPTRNFTYNSAPFGITYSQSLTGVNWIKWDKKLSPLYFEEAKRSYLHNMEAVRTTSIAWFFNLMTAQQNLLMARENLSNADTLYKIAQKKFSKGSIGKEVLMQMKFSRLNAESEVDQQIIAVKANENGFRSFVGIKDTDKIVLNVPVNVPRQLLNYDDVLEKVRKNHVTPVANERQLQQAEYNLATNIGNARPAANLYVSVGANQNAFNLGGAYKDIRDYQVISLGLGIPIEDWGLRKGNVQVAKANLEALKGRIAQSEIDLDQNVYLSVMRYNMMAKRFSIATESDSIAMERYESMKKRYIAGRISVTELNIAQVERNAARSNYIYAIREFWSYYFEIQRISLFDFRKNLPLEVDFNELVRE